MGFLDSLFQGLQNFAESDTAKKMMERSEEVKAAETERTTGINGLRCKMDSLNNNGYDVVCEGTVKNIGKSTYSKVMVKVAFKNENGNVIDKQTVYAVIGETLYPGESMPFRAHSNAKNVQSANVSIGEYEEI